LAFEATKERRKYAQSYLKDVAVALGETRSRPGQLPPNGTLPNLASWCSHSPKLVLRLAGPTE
jgi:hypothetical protein